MLRFLLSRFLQGIGVVLAVIVISFVLVRLAPGGPFQTERASNPEAIDKMNEVYGLNAPWPVQLIRHIKAYVTLNFPPSLKLKGRGVDEIILESFPVSAAIGLAALTIAIGLGVPIGAMSALRPHSFEDRTATIVTSLAISTPSLVLGPTMALIFGIKLGWFNVSGWFDSDDWVLPAVTLGIIYSAYVARLTRGSLRETLAQDFIRTARAKGASEPAVVFKHALKLACAPVLNFLGPAAAGLLTGSFVVENVFQIPGLGLQFLTAAVNKDLNLAMATAAFYAALIVFFNLLVDVLQAVLNPKIGFKS